MIYLLIDILENPKNQNAGIILNSGSSNKLFFDKIIGIGIDSGMSDTFSLHIKRNTLMDFLSGYMNKSDFSVPVYDEPIDYTQNQYNVPILFPMTKEMKELLYSDLRSNSQIYRKTKYLKHLRNHNYSGYRNSPKKYVDLKTGTILQQNEYRNSDMSR